MIKVLFALSIPFFLASPLFADDTQKLDPAKRQKRIEHHEQKAAMHLKVAECLKSGKPPKECRQEMTMACPMHKDGEECTCHHGKKGGMKKEKKASE